MLTIDFETRSAADLKSVEMYRYAEDPTTQVFCLALKKDNEPAVIWVPYSVQDLAGNPDIPFFIDGEEMTSMIENADKIEAHNAGFEMAIWDNVMVRMGFDPLDERKVYCSAAMAAMCSMPRALGQLATALKLPQRKDLEGHRIMMKMCKPRKPRKGETVPEDGHLWHENRDDFLKLFEYCRTDVDTEYAVSQALYDLPNSEREIFRIDHKINTRGVRFDTETSKAVVEVLAEVEEELKDEMQEICGIRSPKQIAKTKNWLEEKLGTVLASIDKVAVADLLKKELPEDVRRVLEIRSTLSKSSTSKFSKLLSMAGKDGRGRGMFMYHGANTGRWSGKGIQPQNLPRGDFSDKVWLDMAIDMFRRKDRGMLSLTFGENIFSTASTIIRPMMMAAEGKTFYVGDYSSIEARALAWMAGDEKTQEVFMSGKDVYVQDATGIFGVDYEDVTKDQRFIGKISVLALGYQGWVGAYQQMASAYGLNIPDERAAEIAGAWRNSHPEIVTYWKEIEVAAFKAVRNIGKVYSVTRESFGDSVTVSFGVQNGWLQMVLPSKRRLFYRSPGFIPSDKRPGEKQLAYWGVNSKTKRWEVIPTYGGRLCENGTQATSRDFLTNAMPLLEDAGYPIVLHIHDEIVSEVPIGYGSLEEFSNIMESLPDWAKGMQLSVPDAWEGNRFRKT